MNYLEIYDQDLRLLGVLDYATSIGYTLTHNDLWTATFSLPSDDPANALCQAHNLIRLPESARDTGLYRIVSMPSGAIGAQGGVHTYSCEHVMATLLDDLLFGYHEIGGEGVTTADVIRYILARQSVVRWQLGVCEYTDEYAYKFENTSLLTALLSLGNVIVDAYTWSFDTSTTPWTINLRHADSTAGCGIYYRRNLVGIEKTMDATTLVTRLYLLGYGEGVNKLTVKSVNGGLPYIDADTIDPAHPKCSVFEDGTIEDADTLLARGRAALEKLKVPYCTYAATALDLKRLTGFDWDDVMPGKLVDVMDDEHGVHFRARVVSLDKADVLGDPGAMTVTIANATRDLADSVATLADRMGISELYSQGATNLYGQQYADNADKTHPAVMRVYVPKGCVRINQMLLSYKLDNFRAYEQGAAAGGGSVSTTGGSGGGTTSSTASGAATVEWDPTSGMDVTASCSGVRLTGSYGAGQTTEYTATETPYSSTTKHHHGYKHTHDVSVDVELPKMLVQIPDHSHKVTLSNHTHQVELEPHTHGIDYGIFEGGQAKNVTVYVDDTAVPASALVSKDMDIVAYLSKDDAGKITRGAWHEIKIVPDTLTRIEANLFVQTFVQSVGGGDY